MLSAEASDTGLVSAARRRFSKNDYPRVYNGLLNRCVPCQVALRGVNYFRRAADFIVAAHALLSWAATVAPAEALRPGGIDGDRGASAEAHAWKAKRASNTERF